MIKKIVDRMALSLGYTRLSPPSPAPIPIEARDIGWGWVQSPDFAYDLASYLYREWISTSIDRVAEFCVSVPIEIRSSDGMKVIDDHPLMSLIGPFGRPNPYQDSHEFLEAHFQRCDIFGNDIWYWASSNGGAPDSVWQLDPRRVIIEVDDDGVVGYKYQAVGDLIDLNFHQITHFRRANVVESGLHWGISGIEKLRNMITMDSAMVEWNKEFFSTGAPSGIMIFDAASLTNDEVQQIEYEFQSRVNQKRRLAVIRARPGGVQFFAGNLHQRDVDFNAGRQLTRQTAFDALGFHTGAVSEASTEAHARVAERMVRLSARTRHMRSASKLQDVLRFWPGWDKYQVRYQDVRTVDWEMEARKLNAVSPYMTVNEVRSRYLDLPDLPEGNYIPDTLRRRRDGRLPQREDGSNILERDR